MIAASARVHPTALIEPEVRVGERTAIWDNVHIRQGSRVGEDCIVGEKTYLGPGVQVGDLVKINAFVYLCTGVELRRGVFIGAGVIFTNDDRPRATGPDLSALLPSEANEETGTTLVYEGASIGARSVVGSGLTIGRFALVGMGSVVTRSVPAFALVHGNPARLEGLVCRCGAVVARWAADARTARALKCERCGLGYEVTALSLEHHQLEVRPREVPGDADRAPPR